MRDQFIKQFRNSICDTIDRMRKNGIRISYSTGKRYYNHPEAKEKLLAQRSVISESLFLRRLTDIIEDNDSTHKAIIEAGKETGKILGWYKPEKVEHSGEIICKSLSIEDRVKAIKEGRNAVNP